jgi:hypothetical protein
MFRFTIRDVLWLMVVVALLIACWQLAVSNSRLEMAVFSLTNKLTSLGHTIDFNRKKGGLWIAPGVP